jgi:hypothetical protein
MKMKRQWLLSTIKISSGLFANIAAATVFLLIIPASFIELTMRFLASILFLYLAILFDIYYDTTTNK